MPHVTPASPVIAPGDIFTFTGHDRTIPTYATTDNSIIDQTGVITCEDVVLCTTVMKDTNYHYCMTSQAAGWVLYIRKQDVNIL